MAAQLLNHNDSPPFADHKDLHKVIDATQLGNVPWQYHPEHDAPPWMDKEYEVWYRDPCLMAHNMLANPTYKGEIDFTPFQEDWALQQADKISEDPNTHGSTFVPIILSSNKTTVSVGTGNNKYYPLYASIRNVHNNVRRAHRDALIIIGFLSIPKTDKKNAKTESFHIFHCQLFHRSLSAILNSLKPAMTEYEVLHCADGHFRRVIYGLGPYIADYEEQVVLSCIVRNWCPKSLAIQTDLDSGSPYQCREHTDLLIHEIIDSDALWDEFGIVSILVPFTNDFPRADIYQLLSSDLLHQLVKGAFKDHLMDWLVKYLRLTHGTKRGDEIMSNIDRRIAAVASFTGLHQFSDSRDFKQWTGNDSKALMKVFLPAIEGHIPQDMVRAFCALLEFCYIAQRNVISEASLNELQNALTWFHHYRQIFKTTGTKPHFSYPRQHSMAHYADMIRLFGTPNGLCSSITESKHIKASSRNNALERKRARMVAALAEEVCVPHLRCLIHYFLFSQLFPDDPRNPEDICACPLWRNVYVRNNCIFVNINPELEGIEGLEVARVKWFFSFKFNWVTYPCALVQWFDKVGDHADEDTSMWIVRPSIHDDGTPSFAVIHLKTVYRAAHLIPVYGRDFIPNNIQYFHSYDAFCSYYVNKFADHHAFEIAS
ncbi:hypothetical protein DFH29DRAFT_985642 [Suillus ampliporus]|nr:hypothetical protein DFH29DRAFT_985642 [Suillus ampliporus]